MDERERIVIESGANVWPHELKSAQALAAAGHTVRFVRKSYKQRETSPDILMDGLIWEMKAPKSSKLKPIQLRLREGLRQSPNLIFDSRRMKNLPQHAILREVRSCAGKLKTLKRLIYIDNHGELIDIK